MSVNPGFWRTDIHRKSAEEDRSGRRSVSQSRDAISRWKWMAASSRRLRASGEGGRQRAGRGHGGVQGGAKTLCRQHRSLARLTPWRSARRRDDCRRSASFQKYCASSLWQALSGFASGSGEPGSIAAYLAGPLADRILFHPYDALPRRLEDADALLRGRFRFAGETDDAKTGSIFDLAPPSLGWAKALHSFSWLPPLALAGGDPARLWPPI